MIILRILLLAFNVTVVALLIYRMLRVYREEPKLPYRGWIFGIGIGLLLLPSVILMGIVRPTFLYLFIYPLAISTLLYLIRNRYFRY